MSFVLKFLGSSSDGNCALMISQSGYFLIDVGLSGRKIKSKLEQLGIDINEINGVFITHEHSDHIAGLKVLSKIENIKFYSNLRTVNAIEKKLKLSAKWVLLDTNNEYNVAGGLSVKSFSIPHDAADPVGFIFKEYCDCLGWATDIGHITSTISENLSKADILVIEANHDDELLWKHQTRPQYLKERVGGTLGHLSNLEMFNFLKNTQNHWRSVYLIHISKDCNSIECLKPYVDELSKQFDYNLTVVNP